MASTTTAVRCAPAPADEWIGSDLLNVRGLAVSFSAGRRRPRVRAVEHASFSVQEQQTVGLVGESGCGKSVTAFSVLGLLPQGAARVDEGSITLRRRGRPLDLLRVKADQLRKIRGDRIAMIFQEPMTSLNPVMSIGDQLTEAIQLHRRVSRREARRIAISALEDVGIAGAKARMRQPPHQFSGGMRQRVMIAMALVCRPDLLIADEPTTALDVTIQAQILDILRDLQRRRRMSVLLISHDLGVISGAADAVCVMYGGRVVEFAAVGQIFSAPLHPYTRALIHAAPVMGGRVNRLATVRTLVNPETDATPALRNADLIAWWPWSENPASVVPGRGAASDYALVEVAPSHWVGVWRTPAALEAPQTLPRIVNSISPDTTKNADDSAADVE